MVVVGIVGWLHSDMGCLHFSLVVRHGRSGADFENSFTFPAQHRKLLQALWLPGLKAFSRKGIS